MIVLFIPASLYLFLDYCPLSKQLSLILSSIHLVHWMRQGCCKKNFVDCVFQDWFIVVMQNGLHSGSLSNCTSDLSPFWCACLCVMNEPRLCQSALFSSCELFSFYLPPLFSCILHLALFLLSFWLFVPVWFLPTKLRSAPQMSHLSFGSGSRKIQLPLLDSVPLVFIHFHLSHILAPCPICLPLLSAPTSASLFA